MAQSSVKIQGKVYDKVTGQPLFYSNILIEGTDIGTVADLSGRFYIENLINGSYTLVVSHIGYKTEKICNVTVREGSPAIINVPMKPEPVQLKELKVTGTKRLQDLTEDKILISQEKIKSSGAVNLPQLLQHVQSLSIQKGNITSLSIRSSLPQHILILIDNIPLKNGLSGIADISDIPLNIIDHIEIYKSGASWKFGSGAIGGAVNIITKTPKASRFEIKTSGGPYADYSVSINANRKTGNLGFILSFMHSYSGNNYPYSYYLSDSTKIYAKRLNSWILADNILFKSEFSKNAHSAYISFFYTRTDRGLPGKIYSLTPYANSLRNNLKAVLGYRFVHSHLMINTDTYFVSRSSVNKNLIPDDAPLEYRRYPSYHYINNIKSTGINAKLQISPLRGFSVQTGINLQKLSFNDENLLYNGSDPTAAADRSASMFTNIEFEKPVKNLFKLNVQSNMHFDTFAMRSGELTNSQKQFSPGIGVSLTSGTSSTCFIKAVLSRSFRIPSFADLFYQDFRIQGKPDLLPEKGKNISLGIGFNINYSGLNIRSEAGYFYNKISDLIVWRLGSFEVFRPYNTDAKITGSEYNINISYIKNKISLTYTKALPVSQDNNITTYGKFLPYRALSIFKGGLEVKSKIFNISLFCQRSGKIYINEANTKSMPGYTLIDLTLNRMIKSTKPEITLITTVYNLFDKRYQTVRDMPVKGRYWNITVNCVF